MQDTAAPTHRTDPVITLIRDGVRAVFGDRLERVVLYGSRARGDARIDSDYDVAVFLSSYETFDRELDHTAALSWQIQKRTGAVISILPFPAEDYTRRNVAMNAIRSEGIPL